MQFIIAWSRTSHPGIPLRLASHYRVHHFTTVKPGKMPSPDGRDQAPRIGLFARGVNRRPFTRISFEDETAFFEA